MQYFNGQRAFSISFLQGFGGGQHSAGLVYVIHQPDTLRFRPQ